MTLASFKVDSQGTQCQLHLCGDWHLGKTPSGAELCSAIALPCSKIMLDTTTLGQWDSSLAIALLEVTRWSDQEQISLDLTSIPAGLARLLTLATDVPAHPATNNTSKTDIFSRCKKILTNHGGEIHTTLTFVGDTTLALGKWFTGQAKTRRSDIVFFIDQAGPKALAIVTLISLLVGMILAYLGSVQLRQLGAQVYVADLVAIGMVREMGALMTAVIMAGRTGAAYAAQIGTMQVNDEVDALRVMGISSMEFLVLPRLLALVFIMPLLCIYADIIGMVGGAIIATSMDVSVTQYILQTRDAVDWLDISTGLIKSIFFGILIAVAGCQAGLHCGRNSNAVGMAATNAVVKAIVYLVVADAAFNILYDKLGI